MELTCTGELSDQATAEVLSNIPSADVKDLLSRTYEYFTITDEDKVLAYGGLVSETFLSPETYVWLVAISRPKGKSKILSALGLAQDYLSTLPWRVLCEVSPTGRRGRHFAEILGFKKILELSDRNVYEWSK